ncbi:internexin neuronal intermediate filament protein, alpha a [Carcharodon carcharias]|uniref:internexin neuronal intermediate filament protein, alpha a n=1 Tax=Carcharodon carcharias TaxID=13397 RepID=UPI001B7EE6A5|nr:internexin neuronal intermediate filament protein, alpha a [Carcharodon carcharias]
MSFVSDLYPSSYRRLFGESPRSGSRFSSSSMSSSRAPGGFRSQSVPRTGGLPLGQYRRSADLELLQSSGLGNEFRITRTNEKEQLQGLNDRFAVYIDKVRGLEQQNRVLEAELGVLRQRQAEPSRLAELYEQEMRELRGQVDELSSGRCQALLDRDSLEQELHQVRLRLEEEQRGREEAEAAARAYKKDVDGASLARLELEKKLESLLDELTFVRKLHDEEVQELRSLVQAAQLSVEVDVAKPDLTAALRDIRAEYENLAARNTQSAEDWYKTKFADMTEAAAKSSEALRANREELSEYRRQLQSRTIEVEAVRGTNESLERQLREMEERHSAEIAGYQDTIGQVEDELRNTKAEMARHLREYQELLNVKMALDIEIAAYRKLLEGEETRLSTSIINLPPTNSNPALLVPSQPRFSTMTTSSIITSKKEQKEEGSKMPSKSSKQKAEAYEEIIEETIVSTKKVEREEQNASGQKTEFANPPK